MRLSTSLLGFSLLLACTAENPSSTSSVATSVAPSPRNEVSISITPVSIKPVSITPVSIPPVSIPSLSLNLPIDTCTPGATSYATPATHGYVPAEACNALWQYSPSFAAAIIFSVLFGALTIAHFAQALVYRNGFCWVVVMAALWETGAYMFRALGAKDQQSSGIATVAQILVLVAPIWVNAYAYMVRFFLMPNLSAVEHLMLTKSSQIFARIVNFFSPTRKVWLFSPSTLALIFVTLDIVSFVVQLIGGGMAGPGASPESQRKGLNLYMGGIGMQEGFIVLFLGLVVKFHRDQLQAERSGRLAFNKIAGWRWMTWALYGCMLAITVRIIYRLVEFSAGLGSSNPLPKNEPLLYVLESAPMFLAIVIWNIFHPGSYMYGEDTKMQPSWLSRHLCSCCHRRHWKRCKNEDGHAGTHHRFGHDLEAEDNQEMLRLERSCKDGAANPLNPFLNTPTYHSQQRVRP